MFERILLSFITIASKLYLNTQLKKLSQIERNNYTMKVTAKLGKITISAIIKERTAVYGEEGQVIGMSEPAEVANMRFDMCDMESTVEMDSEELKDCNAIGLEDMKHLRDNVLLPAGTRISTWIDTALNNFEKDANDRRYHVDQLNQIEVERKRREIDASYPKQ